MLTASYCGKAEIKLAMDRVVEVLERREFPGVVRRGDNSSGSGAGTSTNWGSTSASAGSGYVPAAPQYCLATGKAKERAEALIRALEDKRRMEERVFDSAGYVF